MTHYNRCSQVFQDQNEPARGCRSEPKAWPQTPVRLVLDVAYGPVECVEEAAKEGLRVAGPWGAMQLVALREGELTTFSSGLEGDLDEVRVRVTPHSDTPRTSLIFAGWPQANLVPVEFEPLGRWGRTLPVRGAGSAGPWASKSVRAQRTEIRALRIKSYPHVGRSVCESRATQDAPLDVHPRI